MLLYAPPSIADSTWVDSHGDTARIVRPYSHQWWNWENDPATDRHKYRYMAAIHEKSIVGGYRYHFLPHPYFIGAPVFDYRWMTTAGPYEFAAGDTLEFVYVGAVGQGLNGGHDNYWRGGKWIPGLRHMMDYALKTYYMGAIQSDPYHPSPPSRDFHYQIPIPPPVPQLEYSTGGGVVTLIWDRKAEETPDPLDNQMDFRGYRIYRSAFRVGDWEKIAEFGDTLRVLQNYPHNYVDSTAKKGVPYYYAVTAFDSGRHPRFPIDFPSLESGKTNYKKTPKGEEVAVYVKTDRRTDNDLSRVTVAPNPYLGSAYWERRYEDKIQFMNLPGSCRIRIYTLAGDFVKELIHKDGTGDEYWNLLSRNNQSIVSGVYIYKIETDDGSYKIGKFVILR